jgi:gamma-glutamylaminecyclotransferase
VCVFGTLKAGFPLHEQGLAGLPKLWDCRTVERYPMIIAGPWFAPMIFNEPGTGYHLRGELYAVDGERLGRLDRLESLPKPGNLRVMIRVESCLDGTVCPAFAYMKSRSLAKPRHSGYLEIYDDRRFVPFDRRRI